MTKRLPPAFWIDVVLAAAATLCAALTALMPDWFEKIVPGDLDHHTGFLEWQLTVTVSLAAALFSASAFREWRKSLRAA